MENKEAPSNTTRNHQQRQRRKKKQPLKEDEVQRGPTDTKVVLIAEDQFSKLKQTNSPRPGTSCGRSQADTQPLDSRDFPILGAECSKSRLPPMASPWSTRNLLDPFPQLGGLVQQPVSMLPKLSQVTHQVHKVEVSAEHTGAANETKVKKSRRPIQMDLAAFLKPSGISKSRKLSSSAVKSRRASKGVNIGGNYLDSSMPVRSKGKFREQKKIKLSPLKTEIIKNRILKSIAQNNSSGLKTDGIDIKNEIKLYLANLKAEKEKLKGAAVARCKWTTENAATVLREAKPQFSSKFRSYCENLVTPELNLAVKALVQGLVQLQDRAFARDPVRARAHKRFVTGLREVAKYLKLKKVKLLIVVPDLEASEPNGALTACVAQLKEEASIGNVPCAFALDRRKLGYCSLRKAPVSAFAVLSYEGLESLFQDVMRCLELARQMFLKNISNPVQEPDANATPEVIAKILEKLSVDSTRSGNSAHDSSGEDDLDEANANPFLTALLSTS